MTLYLLKNTLDNMEQEPILNEHNLAESESKANPICFAEPKQGHELNAHNKQEYPFM